PSGSLVFGINTQSNNNLSQAANVYSVPDNGNFAGDFITNFNGQSYQGSFIDSGSNGLFFLDTSTTGIATCSGQLSSWYCPSSSPFTLSPQPTNQGEDSNGNPVGSAVPVNVVVEDASSLFNTNNTAFSTLAGPNPGTFDWGLSFFFG